MNNEIIYSDKLVEITTDTIVFRTYYFPFGTKRIKFSDIDSIEIKESTPLNGKWRIHGSGDFRTWFPRDWKRPSRDKIFIMHLSNSRKRIGFTVENSEKVTTIFRDKKVIKN